ncbi:MAG: acyl carrier protein [Acutalibacteraceae bacterium]
MNIFEKICEIIKEMSGLKTVRYDDLLVENIGLDSLKMVTLIIELEDAFGITFDESDMNPFNLITVKDAAELVRKYKGDEND